MANIKINLGNFIIAPAEKKSYVFADINSNLLVNSNKTDLAPNYDINAIFGSLKNIFNYTPGERMMKPDFGLNLKGLLYEPMTERTANSIGLEIYNTIQKWEPRIKILNINVDPDYDDHTYYITIKFKCDLLEVDKDYYFDYNLQHLY